MEHITSQAGMLARLIEDRRSYLIPEFTGEPVEDAFVERMLEAARWAPNHGKQEPWRFFVFAGEGRATLARQQAELYRAHTPQAEFEQAKYEKLQQMPLQASHVIAICMKRSTLPSIPEVEDVAAVAAAVQNMHLMATALGLGAYWGSGGITYMPQARELFGLGADDRLLGFFYVGMPKALKTGERLPLEQRVTWVRE